MFVKLAWRGPGLGGTRFLSKQIVAAGLAAGYEVMAAARGVHGKTSSGAAFVRWDRAESIPPKRTSTKPTPTKPTPTEPVPAELLAFRPDAVVDVSGNPAFVAAAVDLWPQARWVFISTLNVYVDLSQAGANVANTTLVEPRDDGDPHIDPTAYGAMKLACENLVRARTPCPLILRPGLIVGPGDPTGRFTYWPSHAAQAASDGLGLLAPGVPNDPVQYIDVGDLANWVVRGLANRVAGCFDAVGPSETRAEFLAGLAEGLAAPVDPVFVASTWLARHGVNQWMGPFSIPLWVFDPDSAGLMTRDVTASLEAGLVIRPLADTVRDTLAWARATPDSAATGLTRAEELALLKAGAQPPGRTLDWPHD